MSLLLPFVSSSDLFLFFSLAPSRTRALTLCYSSSPSSPSSSIGKIIGWLELVRRNSSSTLDFLNERWTNHSDEKNLCHAKCSRKSHSFHGLSSPRVKSTNQNFEPVQTENEHNNNNCSERTRKSRSRIKKRRWIDEERECLYQLYHRAEMHLKSLDSTRTTQGYSLSFTLLIFCVVRQRTLVRTHL